jgi:flagellar protein FlaG
MNGIENLTGIKSFELLGMSGGSRESVSNAAGEIVRDTKNTVATKQPQKVDFVSDTQSFEDKIKSDKDLQKQMAEQIEKYMNNANLSVQFGVDKESGKYFFKIVDVVENKVIKQFPPEEILELAKKLKSLDGSLVDSVV